MDFRNDNQPFIVIHVPHASTVIPDQIRSTLCLTDAELRQELLVMTDRYTDEIFSPPSDVASTVVFPVSRLVVDPERFADDKSEPMAEEGMGAVYTRTSKGVSLRHGLSDGDRQSLLSTYYEPHHQSLAAAIREALTAHGKCLMVDAHSFSSKPLPHEPDQTPNRCQICLGTDDFHTPPWLVEWLAETIEKRGFAVDVNRPFSGTLVPTEFYRNNRHVLSIMIEINRSLYMDEATGLRLPGFHQFQSQLRQVLLDLVAESRCQLHIAINGIPPPTSLAVADGYQSRSLDHLS